MATFTCWCGHVIREDDERENCGHILWDNVEAFYDKIAADLLSFVTAQAKGEARAWVREYFEDSLAPYDMTAGEAALGIVYRTSEQYCSGIYRCSSCGRVH